LAFTHFGTIKPRFRRHVICGVERQLLTESSSLIVEGERVLSTRSGHSSFNIEIRQKGNNSSLRDSIFKREEHYADD